MQVGKLKCTFDCPIFFHILSNIMSIVQRSFWCDALNILTCKRAQLWAHHLPAHCCQKLLHPSSFLTQARLIFPWFWFWYGFETVLIFPGSLKNLSICFMLSGQLKQLQREGNNLPQTLDSITFPPRHGAGYVQRWQEELGKLLFAGPWPVELHDFRKYQLSSRSREVLQLFVPAQKFSTSVRASVCVFRFPSAM